MSNVQLTITDYHSEMKLCFFLFTFNLKYNFVTLVFHTFYDSQIYFRMTI